MRFPNIEADYLRYKKGSGGIMKYIAKAAASDSFRAMMFYRLGYYCRKHNLNMLGAFFERLSHHMCHCWISTFAEIGPGLLIAHVCGLVIGGKVIIGSNCDVRQNITIGGNFSKKNEDGRTQPIIGDNVSIGAGAVVVGPISVGYNSIIGANSVVTRDVPESVIVSGVPAVVIKKRWDQESGRRL